MKWTSSEGSEGDKERAAGFVLFREEQRTRLYLLLKHRGKEYWAFPKGHVDPRETDLAAAARELREETGITCLRTIPGFREVARYQHSRDGCCVDKTVVLFLAETTETHVVLSDEHDDACWLSYPECLVTLTYAENRRVLQAAEYRLDAATHTVGRRVRHVGERVHQEGDRGERRRLQEAPRGGK